MAIVILAGCESTIVPLSSEEVRVSTSTTMLLPSGPPAGNDQTTSYIFYTNYDRMFYESQELLTFLGYRLDVRDYRRGFVSSLPLASPEFVEPWRRDQTNFMASMENTVNYQRRIVTLRFWKTPKPEIYGVSVQVVVQRYENPEENLNPLVFQHTTGFGENAAALESDYLSSDVNATPFWITVGRDPTLEQKILGEFKNRV